MPSYNLVADESSGKRTSIPLDPSSVSQIHLISDTQEIQRESDDTAPMAESVEIKVDCCTEAMRAIADYAKMFAARPPDLQNYDSLRDIPGMEATLQRAEEGDWLIELYDTAFELRFQTLKNICAIYLSHKINDIASRAMSPMEGAKQIRRFLRMRDEWTDEELRHLEEEMKLAEGMEQ